MNSSKQVIKRHLQVKTEVLVKDFMLNQDRVLNGEKVLDYTYLDTNEGVSIIADIEVDEHYGKKECMCDKANAIEPIDTYIPHATERVVAGRESPPPTAAQFAALLEKAIFGGCEDRPDDPDYDVQDLDHTPPPEPEPTLAVGSSALVRPEFVAQMEAELQANQHKGDWRRWYPTPLQVLAEIQHHQGKLMLALSAGDCERVKEYAADLANFAMKVGEQFGGPNRCSPVVDKTADGLKL
jgi:hypothetical protein